MIKRLQIQIGISLSFLLWKVETTPLSKSVPRAGQAQLTTFHKVSRLFQTLIQAT